MLTKAKYAFIHLLIGLVIAVVVYFVWFRLLYPYPYAQVMSGEKLFLMVLAVDVVCGPLLTFVLFNPNKKKRELALDMGLVVLIQSLALAYGVYTMCMARPVALVFEVDRFVAVSRAELYFDEPQNEKAFIESLQFGTILHQGIRQAESGDEKLKSIEYSIQGVEPSVMPERWVSYDDNKAAVQKRMKPLSLFRSGKSEKQSQKLSVFLKNYPDLQVEKSYYLPLISNKEDGWSVVIDEDADILGFVALDGFE